MGGEGKEVGGGGSGEGRQGGSAAQFVAKFFFFSSPPFSYVKSAHKLGSLFCKGQQCFLGGGVGEEGTPRPGTPACY